MCFVNSDLNSFMYYLHLMNQKESKVATQTKNSKALNAPL